MKKTALALAFTISAVLSLLAVESQTTAILVKGNVFFFDGSILIVSPENKTYYSSTIILSYRAVFPQMFDSPEHKWILYSLDGGANVTVYDKYNGLEGYNGSLTLSGLSSGNHIIEIYSKNGTFAWGTGDKGLFDAYDRVYFRILLPGESPTPTPTPTATPEATAQPEIFPVTLVFVVSVGIALAAIGLFVYLKKRRGDNSP